MSYPMLTARLSIEPLVLADLDAFVSYRQDPEVARYQSWEVDYSRQQGAALINAQAGVTHPARGEWLQLAVHNRENGELVGDLALHSLADEDRAFELGFTFAAAHQGFGYAREAAGKLVEYLGDAVGAARIIATPDSRNRRSIKLLQNLGFNQQPEKSWTEEFKGELVTVDFYEFLPRPKDQL